MLYDNAQILELLAFVHSLWPDPTFAERARETVEWLNREMRVGDAFAASLDADQDGEEGLFYVWREEEVRRRAGRRGGAVQGRLRRQAPRKLGRPHGVAAGHAARIGRGGGEACSLPREAPRLTRGASEARPRRQGAGRLERPDRRRAGPRQRNVRRAGVARKRARRVRFCVGQAARRRRPAPARMARRPSRRACAHRRLCLDGARRARPVRGERRAPQPRGRARFGERGP